MGCSPYVNDGAICLISISRLYPLWKIVLQVEDDFLSQFQSLDTSHEVVFCFMKTRDRKPQLMGQLYYHLASTPTRSTGIISCSHFNRSYVLLFTYHGWFVHISKSRSSRTTSPKSTLKRGRIEKNRNNKNLPTSRFLLP